MSTVPTPDRNMPPPSVLVAWQERNCELVTVRELRVLEDVKYIPPPDDASHLIHIQEVKDAEEEDVICGVVKVHPWYGDPVHSELLIEGEE